MNVRLRCTSPHATEQVKEYAHKRFARISKFLGGGDHQLDVHLNEESNPAISESAVVKANVEAFGETVHVEAAAHDLTSAIDKASDRMLKAVRRRHGKARHRVLNGQRT